MPAAGAEGACRDVQIPRRRDVRRGRDQPRAAGARCACRHHIDLRACGEFRGATCSVPGGVSTRIRRRKEEVQRRLFLAVVIRQRPSVFELLAREDQGLLVRRQAFLVLNLLLHAFDGVAGFDIERDGLPVERSHEDLHRVGRRGKEDEERDENENSIQGAAREEDHVERPACRTGERHPRPPERSSDRFRISGSRDDGAGPGRISGVHAAGTGAASVLPTHTRHSTIWTPRSNDRTLNDVRRRMASCGAHKAHTGTPGSS